MIRAALTIDSDTRSGDNQRIIAGTPFHPIKIIEAKNTTFFKIIIVKLTSSVPRKLIANATENNDKNVIKYSCAQHSCTFTCFHLS